MDEFCYNDEHWLKIVKILDQLVIDNDSLIVRVTAGHMALGKINSPTLCAGAWAIAGTLGHPDLKGGGVRVQVGHKRRKNLANRVLVTLACEPQRKWIGWIYIPPGRSGFQPKKFDAKQKVAGSMNVQEWTTEKKTPMPEEAKRRLHSPAGRDRHKERLKGLAGEGLHRVY